MATVTICVPHEFRNPVPPSWSAEDCALVLSLGTAAVDIVRDGRTGDHHDHVFATLRDRHVGRRDTSQRECEIAKER